MSALPTAPVALDRHVLGTLKFIRSSIESAAGFDVPGTAGIAMGTIGLVATAAAYSWQDYWLTIWIAAAGLALLVGGYLILRRARRNKLPLYRTPLRRFLLCLCPTLIAGAILTVLLVRNGHGEYLAGLWLLLYGSAVLSASAMTSAGTDKLVAAMATLFMSFGVIAFLLPSTLHTLMLGLGFGGLHIAFGLLIARKGTSDLPQTTLRRIPAVHVEASGSAVYPSYSSERQH
jgi:hypothetical protein